MLLKNDRLHALLFDLDGTLLNTQEGIISSVKHTISILGLPRISDDKIDSFVGPPIQDSLKKHFGLSIEDAQKGANIFREYYKTKALYQAYVYNGILQLLKDLKRQQIKLAVATYKRADYALMLLDYFGITQYCDVIHGADNENRFTKADIVEMCIKELQCDKNHVALVGDTDYDAIGAKKAGIPFIAVTWGFGYHGVAPKLEYPYIGIANEADDIRKYV